MYVITRVDEKNFEKERLLGVGYVLLTDKEKQCPDIYPKKC